MRQAKEIAQDIWALVKQDISGACPFFAFFCRELAPCARENLQGCGVEGFRLWYAEHWLLNLYANEKRQICNHIFLHCLFHCMYLHPADRAKRNKREEELWNLACDIVVEYTVDYLDRPWLTGEKDPEREQVYRHFWKSQEAQTARDVFEQLCQENVSAEQLEKWKQLFSRDVHDFWRMLTKEQVEGIRRQWEKAMSGTSQNAGKNGGAAGSQKGEIQEWYELQQKRQRDYRRFLRRFAVFREEVQTDMETFDYIPYCYGLEMYGNMPFVEPLEYMETNKLEELVIAIDTSSSCSKETVSRFLEETCSILCSRENFFRKFQVYLIQCDCYIQDVTQVTSVEDWNRYGKQIRIQGRGGTDFRPVFQYIEKLETEGKIKNLKGLIYFSDGDGIFPRSPAKYQTAFVFEKEPDETLRIPDWVTKLVLAHS